jgi:hypothetical protein
MLGYSLTRVAFVACARDLPRALMFEAIRPVPGRDRFRLWTHRALWMDFVERLKYYVRFGVMLGSSCKGG